ncbi:tetratricopeptide repeat protein [Roseibium sediminis]|uniref:tetratricopeptide repeat protein n=1 Tax=Roseibium sediminis TaxID=1775174 RepID=UPI001AD8AB0F|nr:hypothetical protein [Roseibium sediminis]
MPYDSCKTMFKDAFSSVAGHFAPVWTRVSAVICLLFVVMVFGGVASAQTPEPVSFQAQPEEGYGRMVLTFSDRTLLPTFDAVITGGVLRISFEEPVDIKVEDAPLNLPDYVSIARRDPDGSAIRFALKKQYRINTLEAGEKLFIDILPMNWQGHPPGLPEDVVRDLAKRAEEALRKVKALEQARMTNEPPPRVNLRIGEHPTFTRLVFDWSTEFDTAFVREEDFIRVTFNHPADLNITQLITDPPPGVVDANSFIDKGRLKFLMRIDPTVDIRAFRENLTYVVDVTPHSDAPLNPVNQALQQQESVEAGGEGGPRGVIVAPGKRDDTLPSEEMRREPAIESRAGVVDPAEPVAPVQIASAPEAEQAAPTANADGMAMPRAKPLGVPQATANSGTVPAANFEAFQPVEFPRAEVTAAVPAFEQVPVAASEDVGTAMPLGGAMPTTPAQPVQTSSSPVEPMPVSEAVSAPMNDTLPPPLVLPSDNPSVAPWRASGGLDFAQVQPQPMPQSQPSPEQPPLNIGEDARNLVAAEARRIGNTVRVVFPFPKPTPSAIFRRHDSIWMVFDTDVTLDTRGMESALAENTSKIDVQEFEGYRVLRVDLTDPVLATVGADGNSWSLVIGDMILEPSIPLKMERNVRSDGGSILRIHYNEPQNIRELEDPFVGDKIVLVTGFGPPRGLLKPQSFVDLDALSSAQGVAVAPKADGLQAKILGDDVIIEKSTGLSLSDRHLRGGTGVFNSIVDPDAVDAVEFVTLKTATPETYRQRLIDLQDQLSQAPEGRRRGPLLNLARFYLAHQFPQEALGLMHLALEKEPGLESDGSFNLMMGAAEAMAGRPHDASKHLNRPDLKSNADAAIWQTIVDAELGNWNAARITMPRGRPVVGNYPTAIQTEFKLAAARALVEANDFGMANSLLAEIEPSEITSSQAARYDLLRGRVADASGRSQEALRVFDLVSRSLDRPRASEAEYRAIRIRFRDGEIDSDTAIDQLSGLAMSWRGDEIELKTLRFLSQLYAEKGRYREAFEAMKLAVQADPEADTTRLLQEEMNAVFTSLFLDGKADEMPTVAALALYYDFRELTPIGRQGDEMVRQLARRLMDVDLLDQATELLQHQVDNRLKGAARAQIAADLGAIYLMDRKPEEALRVINRTRQSSLPTALERQRNIVEARALTASGRPDLALELVRNMRGSEVDRLRADTFWAAQSWREAGEQLEGMLGSRWSDPVALDNTERLDALRAAIAYSLAGDQLSLDRLHTKFLAKMTDSAEAFAFEVVTRPVAAQGVEFLDVANNLADIDTLETFMKEYRRQYMTPSTRADVDPVGEGVDSENG